MTLLAKRRDRRGSLRVSIVCGLADGLEHALGGGGVRQRVALALREVLLEREFFFARALEASGEMADHIHADLQDLDGGGEEPPRSATLGSSDEVPARCLGPGSIRAFLAISAMRSSFVSIGHCVKAGDAGFAPCSSFSSAVMPNSARPVPSRYSRCNAVRHPRITGTARHVNKFRQGLRCGHRSSTLRCALHALDAAVSFVQARACRAGR